MDFEWIRLWPLGMSKPLAWVHRVRAQSVRNRHRLDAIDGTWYAHTNTHKYILTTWPSIGRDPARFLSSFLAASKQAWWVY
jgi:hypothetical protein